MPFKSGPSKFIKTFNKYGLRIRWPRAWIIILGLILIFLCFCIAGMEIGHTIFDVYRSTAFGGFILFIPLMICAIFVLISACVPRLLILRIAVILCCIMMILLMVLIAYDILVLIDPTRCFFLNCDDALVNISNSTTNIIISGWPLYISWPDYFQTNMNAKRIFQSIQLLCAGLFILFSSLYLLTYFIYRHIRLHQQTMYDVDRRTFTTSETNRITPGKYSNNGPQSYSFYNPHNKVTTYKIEGQSGYFPPATVITAPSPRKTPSTTFIRPRANSVNFDQICTRCNREPRMILTTTYEQLNYYPHLCVNCNRDLAIVRQKASTGQPKNTRIWRP